MFWEQFSAFSSVMFLCAFVLRVVGWAAGHDATSHVGWATLGLSVILSCLKFLDVMSMSRVYVSYRCECLLAWGSHDGLGMLGLCVGGVYRAN